jgi:hypothetical protein
MTKGRLQRIACLAASLCSLVFHGCSPRLQLGRELASDEQGILRGAPEGAGGSVSNRGAAGAGNEGGSIPEPAGTASGGGSSSETNCYASGRSSAGGLLFACCRGDATAQAFNATFTNHLNLLRTES